MNELGNQLLNTIETATPQGALTAITEFKAKMAEPQTGPLLVGWVSVPNNVMALHTCLTQFQGVPPKLMSIRRGNMTRARRSILMVQAMELALKKVHRL